MTISRFSLLPLLVLSFLSVCATGKARPKVDPIGSCANIAPSTQRTCVGERIDRKERLMSKQLVSALKALTRNFALYGTNDLRTAPKYLDASRAAWKSYVRNNCKVIAAYGGGSNSAISDRDMYYYEEELDRRIRFLRDVANGTGIVDLKG